MKETGSPRDILATIERYRVEYGYDYRQAWAIWFDRAGLTGFTYPDPPKPTLAARLAAALAHFWRWSVVSSKQGQKAR